MKFVVLEIVFSLSLLLGLMSLGNGIRDGLDALGDQNARAVQRQYDIFRAERAAALNQSPHQIKV